MNLKRSRRTMVYMVMVMGLIGSIFISNVLFTMVTHKHLRSGEDINKFKSASSAGSTVLKASRGTIYDRNGEVIASDEVTYTLIAFLDKSRKGIGGKVEYVDDIDKTARLLAPILKMGEADLKKRLIDAQAAKLYQTELGNKGKQLSGSVKEAIEALNLPGITFSQTIQRNYPNGTFASHLIGFAQYDEKLKNMVGKMGLEQTLNTYLEGQDGLETYQKDVKNNRLPGTSFVEKYAKDGKDVVLTLDRNVQLALENCLEKTMKDVPARRAWAMVVEVETGKILGWSSYPSFDMNKRDIEDYLNVPADYPYEPGSVMKAITYAAAIDSGNYPYNKKYRSGQFHFGEDKGKIFRSDTPIATGGTINDAQGLDHGTLTFDKGFTVSSNIAICELLTNYMSPSIYKQYVHKFGFLKPVEIPFIKNKVGVMNFTYASEILSTGFGQGISINALQMVQAYSAIFNDGKMMRPYVVDRIEDANSKEASEQYGPKQVGTPISKQTSDYMKKLMKSVVEDEGGTARYRYDMKGVSMIAKTGTGQIANSSGYDSVVYTSSVMAAAPADDPKVMMYYAFESDNFIEFSGDPFREAFRAALVAENITGETQSNPSKKETTTKKESTMPALTNHTLVYGNEKLKQVDATKVIIGDGATIVGQYPAAGDRVMSNQNIYVLTDGKNYKMPNMIGWTKKDITAFWSLTHVEVSMEGSGSVVSQNVKAGKTVDENSEIKVKMK